MFEYLFRLAVILRKKIAIIGASGTVGSCAAFAIASQRLAAQIVLSDINHNLLRSHQMDLQTAVSTETDIRVATSARDLVDSEIVVIAAGAPWKRVNSRIELLNVNLPIIQSVASEIRDYCPNAILINVTNPVDPLTWVLAQWIGSPREQCLGYSHNDSLRFRAIIARRFSVPGSVVQGCVIGEHGELGVPIFSSLRVHDEPVYLDASSRDQIRSELTNVFQTFESLGTGRTSGWTSAIGISSIIRAMFEDSSETFCCSVVLDGEFGRKGFSATMPVHLCRTGILQIQEIPVDQEEKRALDFCFDFLCKTVQGLKG
jgi:malate/lactate dehydrogenase